MAYPVVRNRTETSGGTASTTITVNFGTNVAGDLCVIFIGTNDTARTITTTESFTNWTNVSANFHVIYKILDGTEGTSTTVTVAASTRWAAVAYTIQGGTFAASIVPGISTVATGATGNPDATSCAPTGSAKDYLWISAFRQNGEEADDDTWVTSAPTTPGTFTNLLQVTSGTTGLANTNGSVGSAEYQANATSVDAGAFTVAQSIPWRAYTIAIYPEVDGSFAANAVIGKTISPAGWTADATQLKTQSGVFYIGNNDGTGGAVIATSITTVPGDFTANAVIRKTVYSYSDIQQSTPGYPTSGVTFGRVAFPKIAQSFTPGTTGGRRTYAYVLVRSGSPSDNAVVELWSDSGSNEPGSLIATVETVVGSALKNGLPDSERVVVNTTSLSSGTRYWIVFSRSGATSDTDFYSVQASENDYGGGERKGFNGATWTTPGGDLRFAVYIGGPAIDAVILASSGTKTFTADAIITRTESWPFLTDAITLATQSFSFLIGDAVDPGGAWITGGATTIPGDFTANAVIFAPMGPVPFSVDAVRFEAFTGTPFTLDAIRLETTEGDVSADAVLLRTQTPSLALDAVIFATVTEEAFLDAVVLRTSDGLGTTANAILMKIYDKTTTLDAVLFASSGTKTTTTDAIQLKTWWFGNQEAGF